MFIKMINYLVLSVAGFLIGYTCSAVLDYKPDAFSVQAQIDRVNQQYNKVVWTLNASVVAAKVQAGVSPTFMVNKTFSHDIKALVQEAVALNLMPEAKSNPEAQRAILKSKELAQGYIQNFKNTESMQITFDAFNTAKKLDVSMQHKPTAYKTKMEETMAAKVGERYYTLQNNLVAIQEYLNAIPPQ